MALLFARRARHAASRCRTRGFMCTQGAPSRSFSAETESDPRVLVEKPCMHGGTLKVLQHNPDIREMWIESSLYGEGDHPTQSIVAVNNPEELSLDHLHDVGAAMVLMPKASRHKPTRLAVLGLGAGTFPMYLRNFFPQTQVDVIELDPVVVEVATSYFGVPAADHLLNIEQGDAWDWSICQGQWKGQEELHYNFIFQDAVPSLPSKLSSDDCIAGCHRRLSPGGVFVFNAFSRDGPDAPQVSRLRETFSSIFPFVYLATSGPNTCVIGVNHTSEMDDAGDASRHPLSEMSMVDRAVEMLDLGCISLGVLSHTDNIKLDQQWSD